MCQFIASWGDFRPSLTCPQLVKWEDEEGTVSSQQEKQQDKNKVDDNSALHALHHVR